MACKLRGIHPSLKIFIMALMMPLVDLVLTGSAHAYLEKTSMTVSKYLFLLFLVSSTELFQLNQLAINHRNLSCSYVYVDTFYRQACALLIIHLKIEFILLLLYKFLLHLICKFIISFRLLSISAPLISSLHELLLNYIILIVYLYHS